MMSLVVGWFVLGEVAELLFAGLTDETTSEVAGGELAVGVP